MEWKEEYCVLPEIDREHQALVDCVTAIEQAGPEARAQQAALAKLAYQTRSHFTLEETLMRIVGYADIEAHVAEHKRFLATLKTLDEECRTSGLDGESLARLAAWLEEHLRSDDRQYAALLSSGNREYIRNYYRQATGSPGD